MTNGDAWFDRRLSYGVLLAIFVQLAGGLLWAGHAAERLDALELSEIAQSGDAVRLARIEVRLDHIDAQLDRIESRLESRP